ncbi:hypothetical protein SCHPADRAFT_999865, partial [Schizopora paradoxa]
MSLNSNLGEEDFDPLSDNRSTMPMFFRIDSQPSISTTATESNLPGPGRLLGLLLQALGKRFESLINKRAARAGHGPAAVARKTRRLRRHHDVSIMKRYSPQYTSLSKTEEKELKKQCDKLLWYARSTLMSTQLCALEEMLELTIEDPAIRSILSEASRVTSITPNYNESELLSAATKVLISASETETHALWSNFMAQACVKRSPVGASALVYDIDIEVLYPSLRDPKSSFIGARYLEQAFRETHPILSSFTFKLFNVYLEVASVRPHQVEWSNLGSCVLNMYQKVPLRFELMSDFISGTPEGHMLAKSLIREAQSLRKFFECFAAPMLQFGSSDIPNIVGEWTIDYRASTFVMILGAMVDSCDLREQLSYLRNLDPSTRRLLSNTILGNEMLVAYCHMVHYVGRSISPLYRSPCEDWGKVFEAATFLARKFDERSSLETRKLSKFLALRYASFDRYCKLAMSYGAHHTSTPFQFPPKISKEISQICSYNKVKFQSRTYEPCLLRFTVGGISHEVLNFWDLYSSFLPTFTFRAEPLHVDKAMELTELLERCTRKKTCSVDVMFISEGITSWRTLNKQSEPINTKNHYPLLMGYDKSGNELFLAKGTPRYPERYPFYTTVCDGAKSVAYETGTGETRESDRFEILVLCHDPCDLRPDVEISGVGSMDP